MAIKKVKAKSGEMYDVNSPQGQMIVNSAGPAAKFDSNYAGGQKPPQSALGSGDILSTLQDLKFETEDQGVTLEGIEDAIDSSGPSDSQQRKDKIETSNKKKNRFGSALEGFGKGMKSVGKGIGTGFGKVKNSIMDNLGMLTIGAGLIALEKYEEELVGPDGYLTKFLEYLKVSLIPDIKKLYQDTIIWWDEAWGGVEKFFGWMKKKFTQIKAYVDSFDADNSGDLSQSEMQDLKDDLTSKAGKYIGDFFVSVLGVVGLALTGLTFIRLAAGLAKKAILGSALFAATTTAATTAPVVAATGAAAIGAGGVLSIGIMVAAMIGAIVTQTFKAFDASEMPDGTVNWSKFWATFVAGDSEGSTKNAIFNSFNKGATGAGIGALAGFAAGGPLGALVGGMLGMLTGGLIGWFTGAEGAAKYEDIYKDIGDGFLDSKNKFFRYFTDMFTEMEAIIPEGELDRDIAKAENMVEQASYKVKANEVIKDVTAFSTNAHTVEAFGKGDNSGRGTNKEVALFEWNKMLAAPVPKGIKNPMEYKLGIFLQRIKRGEFGQQMADYSDGGFLSNFTAGGTVQEILDKVKGESIEDTLEANANLDMLLGYKDDRSNMISNQSIANIRNMRDEIEEKRTMLAEDPDKYIKTYASLQQQKNFSKRKDKDGTMKKKFLMRESEFLRIRSNTLATTINKKIPVSGVGSLTDTEIQIELDNFTSRYNLEGGALVNKEGPYFQGKLAEFKQTLLQQDSNNNTHIAYSPGNIQVHSTDSIGHMLNKATYLSYVGGGR